MLAIVLVAVRSGKVVAWLTSYNERDPQPLQDFISKNVPINSRVFGPGEFYFYAVQAAGSHYLFVQPTIPPGLLSKLRSRCRLAETIERWGPVYLIWPKDDPIPHDLVPANLILEATFTPKLGKEPAGGERRDGVLVIHPLTCIGLLMVQHLIRIHQNKHPAT